MSLNIYATFVLTLCVLLMQGYSFFRHYYSGVDQLHHQIKTLKRQVEREELRTILAQSQMEEFQQTVATLLPEALRSTNEYQKIYGLRTIASVVANQEPLVIESARSLFESGREAFSRREYQSSNKIFQQLIEQHPHSVYLVESHFLLAEGAYQVTDLNLALKTIEVMISRYPESDLTGFALVRLADIYVGTDRYEDAVEVLKIVVRTYSNPDLLRQAQTTLKDVNI